MAATGKTPILLYGSTTPTNAPAAGSLTNSSDGCEIAINVADKNLFFKDSTNAVNTVPIRQSSTSSNGWLSSTDWNTFNNKQAALVSGTNIKTVNGSSLLGSGDVGTINVAHGGTGLTTLTAGLIPYGNGTSAFSSNANLNFDGSTLVGTNLSTFGGGSVRCAYSTASAASRSWRMIPDQNIYGDFQIQQSTTQTGSTYETKMYFSPTTSDVTVSLGNLVIGTSGKGIDFSATPGTGTSELLADYEEGTWTPVPNPISGSITSYTSEGYYTKTGRQVSVTFRVTITNVGTATAISTISGLPYANGFNAAAGCGREAAVTGNMWQYLIANAATSASGYSYNNNSSIATNYVLYGSITYFN